ncbi:hypothetical protein EX30DRAFT_80994 [Ascodesmis nigricans]|uniref:Uncharacterized protein n=1 Tax=Ascodesmis nigricans TaxID=341454 RepID=A0A4V3SIC6_9PEZI|nr:hypothetical protein EX30DRAFT_80994 [Ascodesmis nigricans]
MIPFLFFGTPGVFDFRLSGFRFLRFVLSISVRSCFFRTFTWTLSLRHSPTIQQHDNNSTTTTARRFSNTPTSTAAYRHINSTANNLSHQSPISTHHLPLKHNSRYSNSLPFRLRTLAFATCFRSIIHGAFHEDGAHYRRIGLGSWYMVL